MLVQLPAEGDQSRELCFGVRLDFLLGLSGDCHFLFGWVAMDQEKISSSSSIVEI